jgi:hypothetical protein
MKRITANISDETHKQISELAEAHHGGNLSAMIREVLDIAVMPHDYYPKRAALEARFERKDKEAV